MGDFVLNNVGNARRFCRLHTDKRMIRYGDPVRECEPAHTGSIPDQYHYDNNIIYIYVFSHTGSKKL